MPAAASSKAAPAKTPSNSRLKRCPASAAAMNWLNNYYSGGALMVCLGKFTTPQKWDSHDVKVSRANPAILGSWRISDCGRRATDNREFGSRNNAAQRRQAGDAHGLYAGHAVQARHQPFIKDLHRFRFAITGRRQGESQGEEIVRFKTRIDALQSRETFAEQACADQKQ